MLLIPMQDVLRLGGETRMNFPGKPGGNWQWRFSWDQVSPEITGYYKYLCELYERPPKPEKETEIEIN
jgi:4-alpha-glucanotransferase